MKNKQASEIIAEYLGTDIYSVKEMVYQPTVYGVVKIYSLNDRPWSYFCCPRPGQKPPKGFNWQIAGYSWSDANKNRPVYGVRYIEIS